MQTIEETNSSCVLFGVNDNFYEVKNFLKANGSAVREGEKKYLTTALGDDDPSSRLRDLAYGL